MAALRLLAVVLGYTHPAKVAGHSSDVRREGTVVTVFSAKGGVGKTTFSTNIGAYLASQGSSVLLVDLDLAFGDVGISLRTPVEGTRPRRPRRRATTCGRIRH